MYVCIYECDAPVYSTTYACGSYVYFVSFSARVFLAIETQSNLRLVQKLLDSMQQALERGQYEHVGSQQLWTSHCITVSKLQNRLDSLHIAEVGSSWFLVTFWICSSLLSFVNFLIYSVQCPPEAESEALVWASRGNWRPAQKLKACCVYLVTEFINTLAAG